MITPEGTWIDNRAKDLPRFKTGPMAHRGFAIIRRQDGALFTVGNYDASISHDEGRTWENYKVTAPDMDFLIGDRAMVCTDKGTIVVGFKNHVDPYDVELEWDEHKRDWVAGSTTNFTMRSEDGGRTWVDVQELFSGIIGDNRDMIQTKEGKIVFSTMVVLHNPGRHAVVTYSSDDDGKTWKRSNIIDLGGSGHHDGVTEAALAELSDGRVLLLLRTGWGYLWQAISDDGGRYWRTIGKTNISASSAPCAIERLVSGRLFLAWNQFYPEGKEEVNLRGADWAEIPMSWHRQELSIAFSEDDGQSWTKPVVIARREDAGEESELAYPHIFEPRPGVIWLGTEHGKLRIELNEEEFVGP